MNWPPPPRDAVWCYECGTRHYPCRFCGSPCTGDGLNAHDWGRHHCEIDAFAIVGSVSDGGRWRFQMEIEPPQHVAQQAPQQAARVQPRDARGEKYGKRRAGLKWEIVSE